MRRFYFIVVQLSLFSFCFCELSEDKGRFTNAFLDHLNNLPDQPSLYAEAELTRSEKIGENEYYVEIKVKTSNLNNVYSSKYLNCSGIIDDNGETVVARDTQCADFIENLTENIEELVTDVTTLDGPIQLENEVQPSNTYTSGEQFIAIPRERPAPCIGCASYVDPHAAGVTELAQLGVKQLDRHEPNTRHSLNNVLQVERQVQVVGGVRYIITLNVDYDNCTANETEACTFQNTCKVSVLEKPWQKLADGSKFRAILSNNCTEEWLFGNDGSPSPIDATYYTRNDINIDPTSDNLGNFSYSSNIDDSIKAVHNSEVQAQPTVEKTLTDEQIRNLEEQIIPLSHVNQPTATNYDEVSQASHDPNVVEENVTTLEAKKAPKNSVLEENKEQALPASKNNEDDISEDKKKAIDELINFFEFAGFKPKNEENNDNARMKRDYGSDLQMLAEVEKFQNMKAKIKNARLIHKLATIMIDYLNEMDIEIKNRFLIGIVHAEEENQNNQHYFYIQARVAVPCNKVQCKSKNRKPKLCNGIIDLTDDEPSVLYTFCYEEHKQDANQIKNVQKDDPVLSSLVDEAMQTIENESKSPYALRIRKIIDAVTKKISGTVTKVTIEIEFIDCNKSVLSFHRVNCTVLENLGSKVCDIEIQDRHWLNERNIVYSCIDRSPGESFLNSSDLNITEGRYKKDPQVMDIVQEALQYLEVKSNRHNKQKLVGVQSVSTQFVGGLLTNVIFVVGYTICTNEFKDVSTCKLLENEPLRNCTAEVWERPWLDDERQVKVACEDLTKNIESNVIPKHRKKRSSDLYFVGGLKEENVSDSQYKILAKESMQKFVQTTGSNQHYQVIEINKVTVQVVSGKLTKIDFQIAPTNCQVDANGRPTSSNCEVQNPHEIVKCRSSIWERPWLKSKEIDVECNIGTKNKISKRSIETFANVIDEDVNKAKYMELAKDSLRSFLLTYSIVQHYNVIKIDEVKKVNVTGDLTKIDFIAAPTNCTVHDTETSSPYCKVLDYQNTMSCQVDIWYKPTLNNKIMNVNCQENKKQLRKRRQLGGLTEQPPTDPAYKKIAEKSIAKYVSSSGITQHYKVTKVLKVNTQVVSGMLTKIDFKVASTDCHVDFEGKPTSTDCKVQKAAVILKCHADAWDQPWLGRKDINVKCFPVRSRDKRQIPGGQTPQDPNNPKYLQMAQECLVKYATTSGIKNHHKAIEVNKVTTQVVSGSKTTIYFKASPTNCLVDSNGQPTATVCEIDNSANILECHAEIWERRWLNKKEITITCDPSKSRGKRQLAGGQTPQDPNNPKYLQMAQECLAKYATTSGINIYHKAIEIDNVTTQVVSGSMTRINFKASPTNCLVDSNGQPTTTVCEIDNSANILECHAEIWEQRWLNKKEINITCDPSKSRGKRQIPGGQTPQDPNNPKYLQMAQECLVKYATTSGIKNHHKAIEVNKVTTQVVSGSKTTIYFKASPTNCLVDINGQPTATVCEIDNSANILECHAEIWEQRWLNKKEITITCDPSKSRGKRQLAGGQTPQDPNNPKYLQMAQECLVKYATTSGIKNHHKAIEVNKVTTQVVSGSKTTIYFKASPTNCLVDSNGQPTATVCEIDNSANILECHAEIWEQRWLNKKEITITCDPSKSRGKRQLAGGQTPQDPNNPKYLQMAQECLAKYSTTTGINIYHKAIEIDKVTTQVVSGSITKIIFKASLTNCLVDGNGQPTMTVCEIDNSTNILECHAEIWEQRWLNKKDITVTCDSIKSRSKRQIPGGLTPQDPNNPKYLQMAQECLAKYATTSGIKNHHKAIEVNEVTTQVVSGSKTTIYFKASPTNCLVDSNGQPTATVCEIDNSANILECHAEIWEQRWLNKKEITITCDPSKSRGKRQLAGGQTPQDPNNPKYLQMAQECLAKYSITSGIKNHHKAIEVNEVTTQVVSGSKTRINFKASPTNCLVDSNGQPTTTVCEIDSSANILECHAEIWEQRWLNKKDITITCDPSKSRSKRQIPGGQTPQDPNNPKYVKLAEESLTKYLSMPGVYNEEHELIKIEQVTTKVVSGTLTKIDFVISPRSCLLKHSADKVKANCKIGYCHSEIWEKPWIKNNSKVIEVSCEDLKDIGTNANYYDIDNLDSSLINATFLLKESRSRRSSLDLRRSGGQREQDPTKPEYRRLALESLRKYQRSQKSEVIHKMIKVDHVATQVVSGIIYKIDFTAAPTTCTSDVTNLDECKLVQNATLYCHADIWDRPWLKRRKVDVRCGNVDIDEDSAEESDSEIRKKRSTLVEKEITEIHESNKQSQLDPSEAPNLTHRDLDWPIEIEMKEKNSFTENKKLDDEEDNNKKINSILEIESQKYNTEEYLRIAEGALRNYEEQSKSPNLHKVLRIHYVTEQDDGGIRLQFQFSAAPTTCLRHQQGNNTNCEFLKPKLSCFADVRYHKVLDPVMVKEVRKVECKERNKKRSRNKRQLDSLDEYIEDDYKYYYADRVLSKFNQQNAQENLYKLVTLHDIRRSVHLKTLMIRMYVELAKTYCFREGRPSDLSLCNEIEGNDHIICLGRLWPSPYDELVIENVQVVCQHDIPHFAEMTGFTILDMISVSVGMLNREGTFPWYATSAGEGHLEPTLDYNEPFKLSFVVQFTNCTKDYALSIIADSKEMKKQCQILETEHPKSCSSNIYLTPNTRAVSRVVVACHGITKPRRRRAVSVTSTNATVDDILIQKFVQESLEKLEMMSVHRYKQRVLRINSHSSRITKGKETTIDFDVGYTNCLKYEWVDNITICEFLEHLPRRHCVSRVTERLWIENGRNIDVNCVDDEAPLEASMDFEGAENAMALANEALKRIEYKYPHPRRQKVVRIFSLEKQMVAGIHYRMKLEVGSTDCMALSLEENCNLDPEGGINRFCRVNVWQRQWTNNPPSYRISCDYQDGVTNEIYHVLQAEQLFSSFLQTHKPHYLNDHSEMQRRFLIFKENVKKVHELNVNEQGTARYAVTRFADLSAEEFSNKYLGLNPKLRDENQVPMPPAEIPAVQLPEEFDWRDRDAVTEVKDQGSCGSCWAFSVTGNIEGQWKQHSGKLVSLSEQELVDCDTLDQGCNGGLPDNAYRAIEQLGGLEAETDYPYEGDQEKCVYNASLSRVHISGAVNISSNETNMAKWLVENGPISIGINANAMQFYVGGISHPWKMLCSPKNLDHGVLIVGFGEKDYPLFNKKLPYWTIKNSWGASWGEQGYYRVYRGDGTCGVNLMASSAVI